jgi:hypothetical protein
MFFSRPTAESGYYSAKDTRYEQKQDFEHYCLITAKKTPTAQDTSSSPVSCQFGDLLNLPAINAKKAFASASV